MKQSLPAALKSRWQSSPLPAWVGAAGQWPGLPLVLLLLALSGVFLFAGDRGHFYRPGNHNFVTSHNMAMAANFSAGENFRLFRRHRLEPDGAIGYEPYSRFPVGSYAAIKLVLLPFDGFAAQIYAARVLMLLFFAGAAVLAYLALRRLTASRWLALGATALTFSSAYSLYYSDMVGNESILFGFLLTFHGMAVFVQEGRFRQLAVKSCLALLLGWQAYALLLPFIILGLVQTGMAARAVADENTPRQFPTGQLLLLGRAGRSFLTGPYFRLGLISLACGILLLGFNLRNESRMVGAETPFLELPTVQSALYRANLSAFYSNRQTELFAEQWAEALAWPNFLQRQFSSIGVLSTPFALPGYSVRYAQLEFDEWNGLRRQWEGLQSLYIGIAVFAAAALGLLLPLTRHRGLLAALLLSGFFWTVAVRGSAAIHQFEGLFLIGVPLVFFTLLLAGLGKLYGNRMLIPLAVAGGGIFFFSAYQMGLLGYDAAAVERQADLVADYTAIRELTEDKTVLLPTDPNFDQGIVAGAPLAALYYLSDSVINYQLEPLREPPDFLILEELLDRPFLLTPQNRVNFLYDQAALERMVDEIIAMGGEPDARSVFVAGAAAERGLFDVYFHDNRLLYVKEPCRETDTADPFLMHFTPADLDNLRAERQRYGFENKDFSFGDHDLPLSGWKPGQRCAALFQLPDYPIVHIRTGQYRLGEEHPLWQVEFPLR